MSELPILQDARVCGTCTMCCKLLGIVELKKPRNKWCPHCQVGKGCQIYPDRPPSCVEFSCAWLLDPQLPDVLKPDRSKVVMFNLEGKESEIQAHVDPKFPDAWRTGPIGRFLDVAVKCGMRVLLTVGDRRKVMVGVRDEAGAEEFVKSLELRM